MGDTLRTYGDKGSNYIEIQKDYQLMRLKARKADKISFGNTQETIEKLEQTLGIDSQKEVVVVTESAADVLRSKIAKLEGTLANEHFLSKVAANVIEMKRQELQALQTELQAIK